MQSTLSITSKHWWIWRDTTRVLLLFKKKKILNLYAPPPPINTLKLCFVCSGLFISCRRITYLVDSSKKCKFLLFWLFVGAGPGPGAIRGQPINLNGPGSSQSAENMQQMQKLMEQEMKSDKYKTNSNKGYVFTLMPLYAIGVGVFAAYKFLKVSL